MTGRRALEVILTFVNSLIVGWLAYNVALYGEAWDIAALIAGGVSYVAVLLIVFTRE